MSSPERHKSPEQCRRAPVAGFIVRSDYTSWREKKQASTKKWRQQALQKGFLSPNDSSVTGGQTLLRVVDNEDDLLTTSPSRTFVDQKHSDEDDKMVADSSNTQDTSANMDRIQTLEKTKKI